ncbi:hypothetical protein KLP28_08965 [Nocardioidaceae bacterium]|nr:hypothetical protein KLP28_08965 [Nocardioidaceae bacterium]
MRWQPAPPPPRRLLLVDGLIAAAIGAVALVFSTASFDGPPALGHVALLVLAVTLRRAAPWVAMGLGVTAGVVQAASLVIAVPADLAYAPLCLALGASASATVRRVGLVCSLAATVTAGAVTAVLTGAGGLRENALTVVLVSATTALLTVGPWTVGQLQRTRRENLRIAVQSEVDAVERRRLAEAYEQQAERSRIAADMHDLVAHSWAVVAAQATGARYASSPATTEQALDVIADTARTAMADLNTIVRRLRRTETDDPDDPATGTLLAEGAYGSAHDDEQDARLLDRMRASGMQLEVHDDGDPPDSPLLRQTEHHLLREALTNALKHADLARPVTLTRRRGADVTMEVRSSLHRDRPPAAGTGHGLVGMRERAAAVGGHLSAGPEGDTWAVRARLPRREGSA